MIDNLLVTNEALVINVEKGHSPVDQADTFLVTDPIEFFGIIRVMINFLLNNLIFRTIFFNKSLDFSTMGAASAVI